MGNFWNQRISGNARSVEMPLEILQGRKKKDVARSAFQAKGLEGRHTKDQWYLGNIGG